MALLKVKNNSTTYSWKSDDIRDGEINAILNNGCCNFLRNNLVTQEAGNVMFTVNSDKSVTVNGSPSVTNPTVWLCDNYLLKAGSYVLSSGLNKNSNVYMYVYDITHNDSIGITYHQENGKAQFTLNSDSLIRVNLAVFGTYTISNETVYPMLYDARLNPTGYVPYAMTNRELTDRAAVLDNNIAFKESSEHVATPTVFDTGGDGMILDLYNKNGVCVGHLVIRPNDFQENVALELYTADWSTRPWTICKDIL